MGYSKALVYSGYCWLCKNKREKAGVLWKKYYNSVYTIIADDEIHETDEQKKKFLDSYDWFAMTEQGEYVWNEIFKFLEK